MKVIERKPIAVSRARCPWCLSLIEYTRRDTIDRNADNPWGTVVCPVCGERFPARRCHYYKVDIVEAEGE